MTNRLDGLSRKHIKEHAVTISMAKEICMLQPPLRESNVGITIADNVYHFSPACDGILDSDKFSKLPGFIHFSKTAMRIVKAGFALSFIYNIIGISFASAGLLTPLLSAILMPLSSVTAVAFATFSTLILAKRQL